MKKILFISAAIAVLCSCAKEVNFSDPVSGGLRCVTVGVESVDDVTDPDDSKAWFSYVDGLYKFKWVDGQYADKVGAFDSKADIDGGHEFIASNKDNNKATLTGKICDDATGRVVFLSPYQSNTMKVKNNNYKTNVTGNKITQVLIPYETGFKAKFMDGKAATRIGVISDATKIESEKLNMYNPLAAIRFTLTNCSDEHPITNIEVFGNYGEQIAGYCDIDFTDPKNPKPVFATSPFLSGGAQQVAYDLYLVPKEPATYTNNEYAAALAPTTFSHGLMFKFIDNKGNVAFKGSSKSLTIERNHIKNIGTIDVSKLDWHFGINLNFMRVSFLRIDLPFVEKAESLNNNPGDHILTYNLKDGSGQSVKFKVYIPDIDSGNRTLGRYDNGLEIKGTGAYLEIPAIEGKVLKRIFLRLASTGGKNGEPCLVRASDGYYFGKSGAFVSDFADADVWLGKKNFGWYKQWNNCFEAGVNYRIQFTEHSEGAKIKDLVLLYDDVTKSTALTTPQVNDWNLGEGAEALMY